MIGHRSAGRRYDAFLRHAAFLRQALLQRFVAVSRRTGNVEILQSHFEFGQRIVGNTAGGQVIPRARACLSPFHVVRMLAPMIETHSGCPAVFLRACQRQIKYAGMPAATIANAIPVFFGYLYTVFATTRPATVTNNTVVSGCPGTRYAGGSMVGESRSRRRKTNRQLAL